MNTVNEAFADDLTLVFRMQRGVIQKILEILENFGKLSGLYINREKTHIMITGKEWEGGEDIEGITIKRECKLLGLMLDYKLENIGKNWDNCVQKISGLINYWNQFNLTLTGRIMVAKTFLLSQVTFFLGIIEIGPIKIRQIEDMIGKYVLGKLQVARDRLYKKIEQGGLGLLSLGELNTAMKSAWVNRWKKEGLKVDVTGTRVFRTTWNNDCETIRADDIPKIRYPIARAVADEWTKFRAKVYENDGHIFKGRVFFNPGITNRIGQMLGDGNIFGLEKANRYKNSLRDVRFEGILNEVGNILPKITVENKLGFPLLAMEYRRLAESVNYVLKKFKPVVALIGMSKTIGDHLNAIKRGSFKLRKLISGRGSRPYREFTYDKIRPINTLWEHLGIEKEEGLLWCGMHLWCIQEISSEVRQFTFKWNQGMVHGNTVISHFGDVDRKCTFCKLKEEDRLKNALGRDLTDDEKDGMIIVDETRVHIFWECNVTQESVQNIYKQVWETRIGVTKNDFLMGRNFGTMEATLLYMMVNMYIKYDIWRYKLANAIPNCNSISNNIKNNINNLMRYQKWRNLLPLVRRNIPR